MINFVLYAQSFFNSGGLSDTGFKPLWFEFEIALVLNHCDKMSTNVPLPMVAVITHAATMMGATHAAAMQGTQR